MLKVLTSLHIRVVGFLGALAPFVYLIAVIIGGYLWSGYSQYSETVSTLTSSGAPNQEFLTPLFAIYNVFIIVLAVGLYFGVKARRHRRYHSLHLISIYVSFRTAT